MSSNNLSKFKADLKKLDHDAFLLGISMRRSIDKVEVDKQIKSARKDAEEFIKYIPPFESKYQEWYSIALNVIKQILPERLEDFASQYNRQKNRKEITSENYTIEDFMQGLKVSRGSSVIVGPSAALQRFDNQVNILDACNSRFETSLFDIRLVLQADLFDSELSAATGLLKAGFLRAAGAMAGVVLEHHLQQVAENHSIKISKKNPSLSDLYQSIRDANVIDIAEWRRIQYLGDIRNKCDHKKDSEPSKDEVEALIAGVERTIKSVF